MIEVTYISIEQAKDEIRQYKERISHERRFAYSNLIDPDKAVSTYRAPRQVLFSERSKAK